MVKRFSRFFRGGFIAVICAALQSQVFAFTVQLNKNGLANGTASISKSPGASATEVLAVSLVSAGDIATLSAQPNTGYELDKWTITITFSNGDSAKTLTVTDNPYKITYNEFNSKYGANNIFRVLCTPSFRGKVIRVNLDVNNSNAAVNLTEIRVTVGEKYTSLKSVDLVANGVSFVGWFTSSSGGTKVTEDTVVTATAEHTLYAHWQALNYKLTFDSGEGKLSGEPSTIVIYGGFYPELPSVSRAGYDFQGWYTEVGGAGTQIKKGNQVTLLQDSTLYAYWVPKKYTVSFNPNGGSVETTSKSVTYDSAYGELPVPTRTGYTFSGWYTASFGGTKVTPSSTVHITSAQTLYAQWTAKTSTVTFNANGGSVETTSKSVTYDSTYGELPVPTRTGYTFSGWYTSASGGDKVISSTRVQITAAQTLYAQWDGVEYELAFDNIFHLTEFEKNINSAKVKTDGNGSLEISSENGLLTLRGTREDDSRVYTYYNRNALSNSGVYAFDIQGGVEYLISVDVGSNLQKDPPARVYILFYDSDGEYIEPMDEYSEGGEALVKGNNRRTIIPPSYATKATIFFNASLTSEQYIEFSKIRVVKAARYFDQEIEVGLKYKYSENERYGKLPVPQRAGYEFSFWSYTEDDSGIIVDDTTFVAPQSRTVYSHWNPVEYVVQLNSNEGNETNRVIRVSYESTYGDLPDATRDGYIFEGWYTEPSGGMIVTPSTKVQVAKDHILYAHWIMASYTVNFDPKGGEFVGGGYPISVKNGETYPALPEVTRVGYGFADWYLHGDIKIKEGDKVTITSNSWAHAVWTNNIYTVSFRKGEAFYGDEFSTNVFYDIPFALPVNSFECLDGSSFAGWRLPDGSVYAGGSIVSNLATSGSVEVVATWEKPTDPLNASGVCKNLYVTTSSGDQAWTVETNGVVYFKSGNVSESGGCSELLFSVKTAGKLVFKWCATGNDIKNKSFRCGSLDDSDELEAYQGDLVFGEWVTVPMDIEAGQYFWLTSYYRGKDHTLYIKDVVWIPDGLEEESEEILYTYTDATGVERAASIPTSWVDENKLLPIGSSDYQAALEAPSGKVGADGVALPYWYDYVAGTNPNDTNDLFRITSISVTNGTVFLTWQPDLSDAAVAREYQILGKESLSDPEWALTNSLHRFFRVDVHLKK
ncbi:MAG: InlB B-repeat-containing protein [Kiritimatiellae bacterium]|nr:InlB B-repeat-containing protein [Kiritimatiellia bacterium]